MVKVKFTGGTNDLYYLQLTYWIAVFHLGHDNIIIISQAIVRAHFHQPRSQSSFTAIIACSTNNVPF